MDTEAQAALRGYNISWQTREGAPYSANDLNRVSAGSAETIILMRPEIGRVSVLRSLHVSGAVSQYCQSKATGGTC